MLAGSNDSCDARVIGPHRGSGAARSTEHARCHWWRGPIQTPVTCWPCCAGGAAGCGAELRRRARPQSQWGPRALPFWAKCPLRTGSPAIAAGTAVTSSGSSALRTPQYSGPHSALRPAYTVGKTCHVLSPSKTGESFRKISIMWGSAHVENKRYPRIWQRRGRHDETRNCGEKPIGWAQGAWLQRAANWMREGAAVLGMVGDGDAIGAGAAGHGCLYKAQWCDRGMHGQR